MAEEKTVLFTTSKGLSYLFDEGGIRRKQKANVMPEDLPPEDLAVRTSRAWSLIDSDSQKNARIVHAK